MQYAVPREKDMEHGYANGLLQDLDEVEELNEFGELHDVIGEVATTATSHTTTPAKMAPIREGDVPKPAAAGSASTSTSATTSETKKENIPQHTNPMAQLAQEAAAKAKEVAKKVPTPLLAKKDDTSSATAVKGASKEKETPLSPSGVPLPMSPAVKSPTSPTAVKLPTSPTIKSTTGSIHHHRHSSTGSAHSYIPEKSEPEAREHRGSEISVVSQEEIKRIESECTITEEDEEEEDEDAILFGDADEEEEKDEEPATKSASGPAVTPVHGKKPTEKEAETLSSAASKPLNIKGGPQKAQAVLESAGIATNKTDNKAAESDGTDEEDSDATEEDLEAAPSNSAPTAASAATTTAQANNLADAVDKVKIQDQDAAEAKQATVSVED